MPSAQVFGWMSSFIHPQTWHFRFFTLLGVKNMSLKALGDMVRSKKLHLWTLSPGTLQFQGHFWRALFVCEKMLATSTAWVWMSENHELSFWLICTSGQVDSTSLNIGHPEWTRRRYIQKTEGSHQILMSEWILSFFIISIICKPRNFHSFSFSVFEST
jgi:hypothetical protein